MSGIKKTGPNHLMIGTPSGSIPLTKQIGGRHYKKLTIQPVEYIHANGLGYFEGTVVKYVSRWRDKGGIEDLQKAIHFLELLIDLEETRTMGETF